MGKACSHCDSAQVGNQPTRHLWNCPTLTGNFVGDGAYVTRVQNSANLSSSKADDKLDTARKALVGLRSRIMAFQPDEPAQNPMLYRWLGELKTDIINALEKIGE